MNKFDTTCRTCNAIRSNLVNLYSNSPINDTMKLYDVLCSVCPWLSIQNNDKLPHKICFFCSKQLEIAYKFQLQCKKSDEELWKIVKDIVKEEPLQSQEKTEEVQENEIEASDEMSCPEEAYEDTTTLTESPEFLEDDDEEMETIPQVDPATVEETIVQYDDHAEASFDCNHCTKKYLTSNGLLMHIKLAHKISKPSQTETFQCKYCNQVFATKDERNDHSRAEHKNDSKSELICYICQKSFLGKNKLDHHLIYHGNNQFQCIVKDCKRIFNIKYKVTDHLKRFHGILLTASQSKQLKPISIKQL